MKRFHWLTGMLTAGRPQIRTRTTNLESRWNRNLRPAECLEARALMDATMSALMADSPNEDVATTSVDASSEIFETTAVEIDDPMILTMVPPSTPAPITVSQFESRAAFGEYLIQRALQQNEGLFGQPSWWYRGPIYLRGNALTFTTAASDSFLAGTPRSQSDTNTQVQGVDEDDIIENDGTHLFVLNGSDLRIIKAFPSDSIEEVARVRIEGHAIGEYLDGDRLTVISQEYSYEDYGGISITARLAPRRADPTTIVSVFDVTDRANPTLSKQTRLDGYYVDSRAINGQVHVITSNSLNLPQPQIDGTTTIKSPIYRWIDNPISIDRIVPLGEPVELTINPVINLNDVEVRLASTESLAVDVENPTRSLSGITRSYYPHYEVDYQDIEVPVWETRERYETRLRENIDALIDQALPNYFSVTSEGIASEGLISEVEAISRISTATYDSLLSVVTIDTRSNQPGLVSASSVMADYTQGMYANAEHLYLFQPNYSGGGTNTTLLQFSWANGEREIELIGTGIVEGTLLNQFSADEFDGHLRVATTVSGYDEETGQWRTTNRLTVLANQDGTLTQVGAIDEFAENERIYSVRFDGDRAFVVTFRQIDPLFYIDLSNPTAPEIKGELKVPGFSSYLQVIDRDFLLAVGRNTDEGATKVTLYNVSDPANPTLVDEETLPRWSWSISEYDHHAFGWFDEHDTLAIPLGGYDYQTGNWRNELVVFSINIDQTGDAAVEIRSTLSDKGTVQRSAFIDDTLYSISTATITATSFADPTVITAEFDLERESIFCEFDFEPFYTEEDDGAADWEYLNLAESRADNELLTALGAVNNLDGQVRVTLLHSFEPTDVTLSEGTLTIASSELETQTFDVTEASSIVVQGTDKQDVINLDLADATNVEVSSLVVLGDAGNDIITVAGLAEELGSITLISGDLGNDRLVVDVTVTTGVRLSGGDGRDLINGGAGNDWLHGGSGNDVLDGGRGNDQLFGSSGRDALYGRGGNDVLVGGIGNDTLIAGAGRDSADGGAGNDFIRGGSGSDALRGGAGDDLIRGDDGNDTLQGDAGNDRLYGGLGNDALRGGAGNDFILGESGNDTLLGSDGNDVLRGGIGLDVVLGEAGDDFVSGESGVGDTVAGGEGNDTIRTRSSEIDESFTLAPQWLDAVFGL